MALKIQTAVLCLIVKVTGGTIESKTPDWLMRPGKNECRKHWPLVCRIYQELTGLELPEVMPPKNWRRIDGVLRCGSFDSRIVEVDESQHFNCYRGMTLRQYPAKLRLAFDRKVWIEHSQAKPLQKAGGFAKPKPPLFPGAGGRHRQRAFRDALADILPSDHGFLPTLRIADFEVAPWIGTTCARRRMADLLDCKLSN